jgi:putative transposase
MFKAYKYKLEPNHKQRQGFERTLSICRELYNIGLEQRKSQRIHKFEQMRQLTELKQVFPEYKSVHVHVLQDVIKRLNCSFEDFFRRCKRGVKPGFPRFQGAHRYDSFTFHSVGFKLAGKYLQLSKIGNVKIRMSRELPNGAVVRTCTIKRSVSGWFAIFDFEYEPVPLPISDLAVGIDVGVTVFATFSDGKVIANPKIRQSAQAKFRRVQRRVARCKRGSNRRRKAVALLRKIHGHIANKRSDFLHKHSTAVIRKYGTIVVEALNIAGMSRSTLAKQILDCGWAEWFKQLSYKAAEAGRIFIAVNPRYTSQTCAECGFVHEDNRKTQADFVCLSCGYMDNADHNAAVNILGRAGPLDANVGRLGPCVV